MARRRSFRRPLGTRRYRKLFVIATEGAVTEPLYFAWFNGEGTVVHVRCLKGTGQCAPPQVLKRMVGHLKAEGLKASDEAWLVVDTDRWTDEQLAQLHAWSLEADNRGLAVSNPKFEYWLLLHFEEARGAVSAHGCSARLRKHLPDYDKAIDPRILDLTMIQQAVRRARQRDKPACADWPRKAGCTTVHRLVENILQSMT